MEDVEVILGAITPAMFARAKKLCWVHACPDLRKPVEDGKGLYQLTGRAACPTDLRSRLPALKRPGLLAAL